MCGIALLYGESVEKIMDDVLAQLSHRGPDDQHQWISTDGKLSIGFVRLAINDESIGGRQPYQNGETVSAFNGEIYNADALTNRHQISQRSSCDTLIIAPLFRRLGCNVLTELDGFYSGIIYQSGTHTLNLLRDHIGKKPLFYGKSKGNIFVVSELKALQTVEWFEQVPLGLSQLDLDTGELVHLAEHKFATDKRLDLSTALELAVVKRLPNQPFGIFLSGGLDSSIIAALANKHRKDIVYFALGNPNSPDVEKVRDVAGHLGLTQIRFISLPLEQMLPELMTRVIYATESYNPSIISNGLATFLLARAARREGIKVVLTGDGADELFGGYYEDINEQAWAASRLKLINDMRFTELRRLDSCTMANGIEARCPFLDQALREISDTLRHQQFYLSGHNKIALRDNFKHLLPANIANRKKISFDVGSGIRKCVVNYLTQNGKKEVETLEAIWLSLFDFDKNNPYFYSYPTFDVAIAKRGVTHR